VAVTRARAGNFHFAFRLLPKPQYQGICALYAFARSADDYSDDDADSRRALSNVRRWREALDAALDGRPAEDPVLPAVVDTVRKYGIAPAYLHELIAGTEMDATIRRYQTWEDTRCYCYRVASVVGIMTIHVFGYTGRECPGLAERTGIAFQLTNILRDVKEDAGRDRIYLPLEDLARFRVAEQDVLAGRDSPAFRALMRFEADRAREYYRAAGKLLPHVAAPCRPALGALVGIYEALLNEIARRNYDVLSRRVSLSAAKKIALAGAFAVRTLKG
jgi:phytoene synthase